jgi:hypothetical protein
MFGSGTIFGNTLVTASPLIGERGGPDLFVRSVDERVDRFSLASGGVEHFASDRRIVLKGLRKLHNVSMRLGCGI